MKKTLAVLLLLTSINAFALRAGETTNIDIYLPKSGGKDIFLGVTLVNVQTGNNGFQDVNYKGTLINFTFDYGISDKMAFFINQKDYGVTASAGGSYDYKGVAATTLGIKGLFNVGNPYLYYDLSYSSYLLSKRNEDNSGSNIFGNNSLIQADDDRDHVIGSVGLGVPFSQVFSVMGVYHYYHFLDTKYDNAGTSQTFKAAAGNTWKLYFQFNEDSKLGVAYGEGSIAEHDVDSSGVTSQIPERKFKMTQIYAIIPIGDTSDLFLDGEQIDPKDSTLYSKYDSLYLSLGFRARF